MHNVELLVPASDLNKLKIAIENGADAVYIGGETFGMKSSMKDFSKQEIIEGVKFAHEKGKKIYVCVNVIPHNDDFIDFDEYLLELGQCNVDALIIGDPGVLQSIKKILPNMEIHLNDQANTTNYLTASFWYNQGIKRVNLAKELSLDEIAQIRSKTNLDLDLEAFVQGEMIISYSGRTLISNFMKGKNFDAKYNSEEYAWKYSLTEEKRPGEYYPVYEDKDGTFLFNSKDLCMINHIECIIKSGITSLRIEGRMKSDSYLATIIRTYRKAIDEFYNNPNNYKVDPRWIEDIQNMTHREYTTGFYLGEMEN